MGLERSQEVEFSLLAEPGEPGCPGAQTGIAAVPQGFRDLGIMEQPELEGTHGDHPNPAQGKEKTLTELEKSW